MMFAGMKELTEVRNDIKGCFADLSCYLMPHPGLAVAEVNPLSELNLFGRPGACVGCGSNAVQHSANTC